MTIKRQIFLSNIRTVLVTLFGFFLAAVLFQYIMMRIMGFDIENERSLWEEARQETEYEPRGWHFAFTPIFFILFMAVISLVNNLLNYRLLKNIVRPLQPLGEGVRQIRDNNLAFRIDYAHDDEYRPICDAFNEMAARLEASAARKQQDEANRRELIAGISHDLRTPLTSIKGCIEGLETGVASTPEMRNKYFAVIKNKAADLEHIIERLFLFSKLDMDEFPLALRRVSLLSTLEDIIEEYDQRGLAVYFSKNTEHQTDLFVMIDSIWFRNVVVNILENSVRYKTKARGTVEIRSDVDSDAVRLSFADDGPGVSAELLPKLFDVFFRADPSRTTQGSGLGLAISKKIIERMGGAIRAELPAAGGLAVVIELPLAKEK